MKPPSRTRQLPTANELSSLARTLAGRLAGMAGQIGKMNGWAGKAGPTGQSPGQLAGAGVGIASAVDADGVLRAPPMHKKWDGLPLRTSLATQLGCRVAVAQDDHLSPIAEGSDQGTFPGTSSLLVLELSLIHI